MSNFFINIWSGILFVWNTIFFHPILNLFILFYKIAGNNFGFSIIILTILIRILLWPTLKSQIISSQKMQKVQPKLKEIQKKYKSDLVKLREEQMKLFKEEGVSPYGSCLSLIVQLPFLWAIYEAILMISTHSAGFINKIMYIPFLKYPSVYHYNINFFFLGNISKDATELGLISVAAIPYILLSLLVGYSQYLVTKVMLPSTKEKIAEETTKIELAEQKKGKEKGSMFDPEMMGSIMSKQMLYFMPIFLVIISLGIIGPIPAALSIYWAVQSLFMYFQTRIISKSL